MLQHEAVPGFRACIMPGGDAHIDQLDTGEPARIFQEKEHTVTKQKQSYCMYLLDMNPEDNHLSNPIAEEWAQDLQLSLGISRIDAITYVRKRDDIVAALVKAQMPSARLAPATAGEERQLITRRDLPEKAPALWARDKQPGDTPPDFIKRHYAPWLGSGLTRADVRRLDPQLYRAFYNWSQHNSPPEGFELPTLKELNDAQVRSAFAGGAAAPALPSEDRDAHRVARAYAYRLAKDHTR